MKITRKIILPTLFCLILVLASCNVFSPSGMRTMSRTEHAIISAIIDSMRNIGDTVKVYDISDSLIHTDKIRYKLEKDSISVDTALYGIFESINQNRRILDVDQLPENVILESSENPKRYSTTMCFSRPAISRDGNTAIIEYLWNTSPGIQVREATLLNKQDGEWQIVWYRVMYFFEVY